MPTATVELPEPKFQKGDVVRRDRLILHIFRVEARGTWDFADGKMYVEWESAYRYSTTVQEGFGCENNRIRPGTFLTFPEMSYNKHNLSQAVKIEWDKPIIEPDSDSNLMARWKAWDEFQKEEALRG